MAIVNYKKFPFIGQDFIDWRTWPFHWELKDWTDNDYWYCEIFSGESLDKFPLHIIIEPETLEKIKTDERTFLYINNSHEAFHRIVPWVYKSVVNRLGIPAEKIYVMTESADLHTVVQQYADEYKVKPFRVEWVMVFQANVKDSTVQRPVQGDVPLPSKLPSTLHDKPYPKRFLNFNRRWRLHRPTLVAMLIANDLVDYGHVSLGVDDGDGSWHKVYGWIEYKFKDDPEVSELLRANKKKIITHPPMYLDTTDLTVNQAHISSKTNYLYEDSLVSVVSETNFFKEFERGRFLSEKTWKPIALRHPFIMVTVPKTLELLREMGYKTFSPWIDESYDQEDDDVKRMKLIVKEIERISKMSDEEVKDFIMNVRPIVDHNRKLFAETTTFIRRTL